MFDQEGKPAAAAQRFRASFALRCCREINPRLAFRRSWHVKIVAVRAGDVGG